jgi:hypothetical protein
MGSMSSSLLIAWIDASYFRMFMSMVMIAVQSIFYLEMYQNNIFFIFKKLLFTSTHQNDLKTYKKIKFLKNMISTIFLNVVPR